MYYSTVDLLALLVLLIQNQDIIFKSKKALQKPARIAYKRFLITVIVYLVTDTIWGVLEHFKLSIPLFIDTSVYFVVMALGILTWTSYTVTYLDENDFFGRLLTLFGRIFAVVVSVLTVINIFVPILFTIDEKCVYHALSARYVLLAIQIVMLVLVSVYAFFVIFKKKSEISNKYRTLGLFGIIMAVFLFAQLWYPYLPLYAIGYMLGICLIHTFVIGDEKEKYKLGMEEAKKIADLRQSITSLLNNMPVLSFSKDVKTGEYLACNQPFAKYANKENPSQVSGLTDYQIFDKKTAKHFVEDDKKALSMDKPYVLYEAVADAAGNPRNFQTTKLKFYDENDRLCLLGMSLDITEMVKAKKENEETKAAYREILNASTIYEHIVGTLTEDYFDLYYINLETDEYIEYGSKTEAGHRSVENRGTHFFDSISKDATRLVYKDDREGLVQALTKENLIKEIRNRGMFRYYYRLMIDGEPTFVSMKATNIIGDDSHIIIGITNVNDQMKDRMAAEQAKEEQRAYLRLNALNNNQLALYIVDTESENYTEFRSTSDFDKLGIEKQGDNFFEETYQNSLKSIFSDDLEMFHSLFTKENILKSIKLDGIFVLDYRLVIGEKPIYVRLKAAEIEENGEKMLIVGIEDIDAQIRHEQEFSQSLSLARKMAMMDALTGVKNTLAFEKEEQELNEKIEKGEKVEFSVVVCDINDLKNINDTMGHRYGDEYIKKACKVICEIFVHSPVYRIGGDEFAIICQGQDYENIDSLLDQMNLANTKNKRLGEVQIACGMARYERDENVEAVFKRADDKMYEHKEYSKFISQSNATLKSVYGSEEIYEFPDNLRQIYESSPLSYVYYQNINGEAVPILVSDGFCRNTGMSRDIVIDWLKSGMFERMHPDDAGVMSQISDEFLHKRAPYDTVFRCRLPDGEGGEKYVYIHGLGKWQTMPDGTDLAVITYGNLSNSQKLTIEQTEQYTLLRNDAFYKDPLTELPNLNYLHEFGEEKFTMLRAEGKAPAVVYIDIHSMQSYNNRYGYKQGDEFLRLVAKTLTKQFPHALIMRGPDDHFIVVSSVNSQKQIEQRLKKVNKSIRKKAFGNTAGIRCGVYSESDKATTLIDALDYARRALKLIENDMNREVAFFSYETNEKYLQARYIIEHFDKALAEGWIKVYYHGLYRVTSQKVAAFEALARWEDPQRGKILPSEFIPVLLKYHQLYKLDLFMFEQVCREVIIRHDNDLPLVPVSVNFSRQDFLHADVIGEMNRLYEKYELDRYVDKGYFIVEITEQDLASGEATIIDQLAQIRANGYRLWLDDFGSGYSAINVFSRFEFDLIKYDMELLKHLDEHDGMNRLILQELVFLARKLGIHTLIEGLETEEHLSFVKDIGCELVQGFYYHKPESLDKILTDIHNGRKIKPCETPEERIALNKQWFDENKES